MDLEAVRTFLAVADKGQFQAAADELGTTRQAVSKRVAGLERALGVPLLPGMRADTEWGAYPTPVYPHSVWREDNAHPGLAAFLDHPREQDRGADLGTGVGPGRGCRIATLPFVG